MAASVLGCQSSESDTERPGAVTRSGAESSEVPAAVADMSSPNAAADGRNSSGAAAEVASSVGTSALTGGEGPASSAAAERPAAPPPAAAFAACVTSGGAYSDCDTIYVTMTQASPARCVQLTIDNCGGYGARAGLSADLPLSWRLASGSLGSSSAPCELGVFYPANTIIGDASGSISWNESTRQPSAIELELTLEPLGSTGKAPGIEIITSEPLNPSPCDD